MRTERDEIIQTFLLEYVEPDGKDVLEVGCGAGRITALLSDWAASWVGLDVDAGRLAEAEARVPGVAFIEGDGEALDFPDGSFDVVLFSLSLHHMDAEAALWEAHRVLRPGGRVVVLEPVPFSEAGRVCAHFRDDEGAHEQAQRAMAEGPLPVARRDLFRTEWVFDDEWELAAFLFRHFEEDEDEDLAHVALSELGDKRGDRPLTVQDDLLAVLLAKVD